MKTLKRYLLIAWLCIRLVWSYVKTPIRYLGELYFVLFTSKSEARVFNGRFRLYMAKKYADRRTEISRINEYCGGKRHYVIPMDKLTVVVLNSSEINRLKAKGILKKTLNIKQTLEIAVYVTKA